MQPGQHTMLPLQLGKAQTLIKGQDITIIACGKFVDTALQVAKELEKEEIKVEVINPIFINPLDETVILESVNRTKKLITIEDGYISGGFGSKILELLSKKNVLDVKTKILGYPNKFIEHGNVEELEKKYGLDVGSIVNICKNM